MGVSKYWQLDCWFNNLLGLTTKKPSKVCIADPVWGEPPETGYYSETCL